MPQRADPSAADTRPSAATPHDRNAPKEPLRLQVMSDLHFETYPSPLPRAVPGVDAVVVAGDTCEGAEKAFAFLRAAFPEPMPLVVVLGNREFHGRAIGEEIRRARAIAPGYGVALLDDDETVVDGVRFLGSTLWTDYRLCGGSTQVAAVAAAAGRPDHRRIALSKAPWRRFTPLHAIDRHERSSAWLSRRLTEPFDGSTVVVTHHAPSARSLDPDLPRTDRDGAMASALDRMVVGCGPALWLHGHVHASRDYGLCRTRVVCNAKGPGDRNPSFDPSLVIEVPR